MKIMLKKRTKSAKKPGSQGKNKNLPAKKSGSSFSKKKEVESDSNVSGSDDESSFYGQNRRQDNGASKWYEEFPSTEMESTPLEDTASTALRKEAGAIFEQEVANSSGSKIQKPDKPKNSFCFCFYRTSENHPQVGLLLD